MTVWMVVTRDKYELPVAIALIVKRTIHPLVLKYALDVGRNLIGIKRRRIWDL